MLQNDVPSMVPQRSQPNSTLNSQGSASIPPKSSPFPFRTRRLSLSIYIPLLLILTAIVPLLVTVGSIELFLRPALISQISTDMKRVTQTHIQLVDTYLSERLNDVKTLSESNAVRARLNGEPNDIEVRNILLSTQHRDVANYISISLLNAKGTNVLSYPASPQAHGQNNYLIIPEARNALKQSSKIYISNVFYNLTTNIPSVDFYARVTDSNFNILGYVRASLGLRRIWEPVDSEPDVNGAGTYATILDQNGVRIAYTNSDRSGFTHSPYLFKSVAQLSPEVTRQIKDENLYGNSTDAVVEREDSALAAIQQSTTEPTDPITPAGQQEPFQVARYTSSVVPWTYILFKPFSAVTGLADQQLISIFIIVTLVLIIALATGLFVGRNLAVPILRSVSLLRKSNVSLKALADEESVVAAEQTWMVEASQVALKSVQYYTNATSVAAKRINTLSNDLVRDIHYLDKEKLQQALYEMIEAAVYIERSVKHQETMNNRLATSLRVTTQATEQLTRGATATNEAASQMEYIVEQLTTVVGER